MGAQFDLNALSGINASSQGLSVIANNLANAETVGFKSSRAEFGDLFSGAQNSPGNGAKVAAITQDFQQGTINGTGRDLDMAIDGEGFFVTEDRTGKYDQTYTRNGSFKIDADGYLTTQSGDKVLGYNRNDTLSEDGNVVFDTTLSGIDLDALNRTPQATQKMEFDINLDAEQETNLDPQGVNSGGTDDDSVGSRDNLRKLFNPEGGDFGGFPDFSTKKTIHDSLGGEHQLTTNFYKRDVVTTAVSGTDANGAPVAAGTGVKYTSWLVQYTVQDFDQATGDYSTSGHVSLPDGTIPNHVGTGAPAAGQVYEIRFDTNGELMGVYQPDDGAGNYDITAAMADGGVPDLDPTSTVAAAGAEIAWTKTSKAPRLHFIIDQPVNGATDPLGGEIAAAPNQFEIKMNFDDMTQFAGSYNLRGVTQDGFKIGDLVGLNTGADGVIEARYSNGRSLAVAQLGVANFTDKNALEKLGGQTYAESFSSGTVQLGKPQENGFGAINAGSLEYSNVDTASELVRMIQTQRTYQASAQVITTSQDLMQRVLQL